MMTVSGGPFNSLEPAVEQDNVLYGDSYNRAYLYNAATDVDMNKYEDGHASQIIKAVVENPVNKMVLTLDEVGTLNYWDPLTNATQFSLQKVLGHNATLSGMILNENGLLVIVGRRIELVEEINDSSALPSSGKIGSSSSVINSSSNSDSEPQPTSSSSSSIPRSSSLLSSISSSNYNPSNSNSHRSQNSNSEPIKSSSRPNF